MNNRMTIKIMGMKEKRITKMIPKDPTFKKLSWINCDKVIKRLKLISKFIRREGRRSPIILLRKSHKSICGKMI